MPVNNKSYSSIIEEIEKFRVQSGASFIDSIIEYCAKNNLEPESIVRVIKSSKALLASVEQEATDLHYLRRSADPIE